MTQLKIALVQFINKINLNLLQVMKVHRGVELWVLL